MPMGLTRNQRDCARVIHEFQTELGRSPSYAELRHELGLSSASQVHFLVAKLEERGWARRPGGKHGSLELLHVPPMPDESPVEVTEAGLAVLADRSAVS